MYGAKVDRWIAAGNKLMSVKMMDVFINEFMASVGLDTIFKIA